MHRSILSCLLVTCVALSAQAQNQPGRRAQQAADPTVEIVSSGIPGVIAAGTKTELLRAGFTGTEGVIGMPDGSVLFCEQSDNKIIKLDLDGNFSTYLEDTNRTIGLGFDSKGRLIGTQSREPRIAVLAPTRTTLADSFEGQPLVRPNDLVIDRKDGIYFTDPVPNPTPAGFHEPPPGRKPLLFYITPKGEVTKVTEEITDPNGVQLSPDQKTLYAANGDHIVAFDVQADGSVKNPRKFADSSGDGMVVDAEGRLYAAVRTGIQVISPKGELLGVIGAPNRIQSFAFAGKDKKTIYAVGQGAVYRIQMLSQGLKDRAK